MGFWQRFVAWLFEPSHKKGSSISSSAPPPDIDAAEIADDLNLHEEARRLGKAGYPSADSVLPSGTEAQIVQRIDRARLQHIDWAENRLSVLNTELSRLDITSVTDRAAQADGEFSREANEILAREKHALATARVTATGRRRELEEFRTTNRLSREAAQRDASDLFLRFALLLAFVVLEGVANAWFFAQGMEGGLVMGFAYAGTLSFINVLFAAALGFFWVRNIFHCNPLRKACGCVGILAVSSEMVIACLVIAHTRIALETDAADPGRAAWDSLVNAPLGFHDLPSWVLIAVTLSFALVALVKSINFVDVYPGYSRHASAAKSAEKEYQRKLDGLRKKLKELKDTALTRVSDDTKTAQANLVRQESLLDKKANLAMRLERTMHDAERCLQALIIQFRAENQVHRSGLPPPTNFSEMPTLQPVALPDFQLEANRAAWLSQQSRVQELLARLQDIRAAIQSAFTEHFDALTVLDSHMETALPKGPTESLKEVTE